MSNWFGQDESITGVILNVITIDGTAGTLHDRRKPWVGSGMCNECYFKKHPLPFQ